MGRPRQSRRQRVTGNLPAGLVFLPARTGKVSAYDTLEIDAIGSTGNRRTSVEPGTLRGFDRSRQTGLHDMVRYDGRSLFEPETGKLIEHRALSGNRAGQNDIERGNPIAGNEQQIVTKRVAIADFALPDQWQRIEQLGGGGGAHSVTAGSSSPSRSKTASTFSSCWYGSKSSVICSCATRLLISGSLRTASSKFEPFNQLSIAWA